MLKELTCWNGSKDPQIELWLERTPAQNWTNNYQHLSPKSIWHKVKLLPPDVLWISFSYSLGWFALKGSHNTKRIAAKSQTDILHWPRNYGKKSCTWFKSITFFSSFQIFISLFKTIAALDYLYRSFYNKGQSETHLDMLYFTVEFKKETNLKEKLSPTSRRISLQLTLFVQVCLRCCPF